ncbi:MAG: DNA-directed RNA polymerase subunit M [Sulfolobaceae archaeon]
MRFCPKCGSVMRIKGNGMVCNKCGYREDGIEKVVFKEKINHDKDKMIVADGEPIEGRIAVSLCPRCGSTRAILLNKKKRVYRCMVCNLVYTI